MTGDEDTITDAHGSAFRPALSPDGTRLVYGTRVDGETGLRIRDLDSGEERWLKFPVQRDEQESLFSRDILPGYAFTPDGKAVIAAYGGKLHRIDVAGGGDRVIPFTAKVALPVGSRLNFPIRVDDGPVRARLIQAPSASPDGKRLAFSALTRLYVIDLPDGKPRQLSADDAREFHPAWSPDGKSIAYVSWSPSGGHLWTRPADGNGPPRQLTRVPALLPRPGLVARRHAGRLPPRPAAGEGREPGRVRRERRARPDLGPLRRRRGPPDRPGPRRQPRRTSPPRTTGST